MENFVNTLFEDLIVAALGGFIVFVVTKAVNRYKRWKLEKKYPISGEYLSSFEDEVNGNKTVIKAPVKLAQNGLHVDGVTELDGRAWLLKGELSTDGYIHGIYHAESVHDRGVGNFFLEITIEGDMYGLWSGYDSTNKKIQSGKYSFIKIPEILISKLKAKQIPSVLRIAEKQLGEAYINVEDLKSEENIAFVATISGRVVGFCTAKNDFISNIYKKIPQLADKKLKQLEVVNNVGLISSIATDPEFTGHGVGDKLLGTCLKELKESGSDTLLMTGWKSDNGVHIGSLAKKYGFNEILEIPNFWYEDSMTHGYRCPSCGEPPCECSAVVLVNHAE